MLVHSSIVLAILVVTFIVARMAFKLCIELSIFAAAIVGGIYHTHTLPVRHLVEGAFTYFDVCLIFITATLFINLFKEAGGIAFMVQRILRRFHNQRKICLMLLTLIMLIPGALTGAGAATVLTVGSLVGTVLMGMGVSHTRTAAAIFLCACMSAAAPPVNLWAMMTAAGSNMPYVGFMLPLLVLTVSGALFSMFWLAGRGTEIVDIDKVLNELPVPPENMNWFRVAVPFVVFIGLILAGRLMPHAMPVLGLPLIFVLSSFAVLLVSPRRLPLFAITGDTVRSLIPLVGIMIAVGILIQIMALSGARGLISLAVVTLPLAVLFCSLWFILPVSEGLLQYAVAPLLGVPLVMLFNMRGMDVVIALSAMSVMWPLGDCLPPTAVVGRATVMELKYKGQYYAEFLKACLVPGGVILLVCTLFIVYSKKLTFLIGG